MDMIALAEQVATRAHAEPTAQAGRPAPEHPRREAARAAETSTDPEAPVVGWLHDVVEDTEVDLEELARLGFSATVLAAVDALTRRAGEGDAYYARVAANPLAKAVKLADIWDNMHPDRVAMLNVSERDRLGDKYRRALDMLGMLAGR